jgi:hypothetical protein
MFREGWGESQPFDYILDPTIRYQNVIKANTFQRELPPKLILGALVWDPSILKANTGLVPKFQGYQSNYMLLNGWPYEVEQSSAGMVTSDVLIYKSDFDYFHVTKFDFFYTHTLLLNLVVFT